MAKSLADRVIVNPSVNMPPGFDRHTLVSFVPMADVTEGGEWINHQTRPLGDVGSGFTPFSEGDVLLAKITPCLENGKGAHVLELTNGVGFGSTEFHVLRARDHVVPRFIHHVVQSRRLRLAAESFMTGSAGQKRVPREFFRRFQLPDFAEPEQVQISVVLDTLDIAIRKTEAIIAKLKLVKQGLLYDLLTRGIDASGELRPPQSQAPHLYKLSPLGWIPKEWSVCGVLDVARSDRQCILTGPFGAQLGQSDFITEGVPVLRIGNVQAGYIDWSDLQFVSPAKAACLERFRVATGDLLFARQGATTGRSALADERSNGAVINYHIIRVAVDQELCDPTYLHALFNSNSAKQQIDEEKGRGTREGINSKQIAALRFALPPIDEQHAAVARMFAFGQQIELESVFQAKLLLQKTALMDDLLTGRVRVTPLLEAAATP